MPTPSRNSWFKSSVAFADSPVGPLGQLVVAEEHVDLVRELAFQCSQQVDELMRFIAAGRITEGAMDQFLQNQVSPRMRCQLGLFQQQAEIRQVPVQISRRQHLEGSFQVHNPAGGPAYAEGLYGPVERVEETVGVGHWFGPFKIRTAGPGTRWVIRRKRLTTVW